MPEENKDELIKAQNEVIGILFEVIKRLQTNNDLDSEYFQIITSKTPDKEKRLEEIMHEREENGKIAAKLLKKLEV